MEYSKSKGYTSTEQYLSDLCEKTFLKLWVFPNVVKEDGQEVCDVLALFDDCVFLFFDRHNTKLEESIPHNMDEFIVNWKRWKKDAIDKQIRTLFGAEKYIRSGKKVFLDAKRKNELPIKISSKTCRIFKIVVAHGAQTACKEFSKENMNGSLAISYSEENDDHTDIPFHIILDKKNPIHIFDSFNLNILLSELDTITDFKQYLIEKENAIAKYNFISYVGEEDLLGYYLQNIKEGSKHYIGTENLIFDALIISEGIWNDFMCSSHYKEKKNADQISYLWDEIIQKTCLNTLNGSILGDADFFNGPTAIHEMAKEPRFFRRELAKRMHSSIINFPKNELSILRNVSVFSSYNPSTFYVFLQLKYLNRGDYERDYRPKRRKLLEIACGVLKNKMEQATKIIGIAIDAPKYFDENSEDFILLNCDKWTDEEFQYYEKLNARFKFFETKNLKTLTSKVSEFL